MKAVLLAVVYALALLGLIGFGAFVSYGLAGGFGVLLWIVGIGTIFARRVVV